MMKLIFLPGLPISPVEMTGVVIAMDLFSIFFPKI
jgi:hypothetical protein